VERLRSVNGLPVRANASTGQTLLVPVNGEENAAESEFEAFNMHLAPTSDGGTRTIRHTVRKGETLASVARRYRVSIAALQGPNGKLQQLLKPGQTITVVQAVSRKHPGHLAKSRLAKSGTRPHKQAQRSITARKQASNDSQKRMYVAYNALR